MPKWTLNLGGHVANITGYTDSDWGSDQDNRKSIGAYVFRLGDSVISWKTKKQSSVALSSVEAEYMAMCQAAKESVWLTGLFEDFGINLQSPMVIFSDSQGAIALANNPATRNLSTLLFNIISHVSSSNLTALPSDIFPPKP